MRKSTGLVLAFVVVVLAVRLQAAEAVKVHGMTMIPWAKKVGSGRYRSPRDYEATLRWYSKFFAGNRHVRRYREVNVPGVKYVHYENTNPRSEWSGLNIYQKGPHGQVMLYVIPRDNPRCDDGGGAKKR